MRRFKIGETLWHNCYFICDIPNCKNFFGIYYSQVLCIITEYTEFFNVYLAKFNHFKHMSEQLKVLENNLSRDVEFPYENLEFKTYFPIKYKKQVEQILSIDRDENIIDPYIIGDLFITYGFPIDLTLLYLEENKLFADERCVREWIIEHYS